MEEEVKELKEALRIIDCKYVSSEISDTIKIRLTYKNRNYILHINNDYHFVTLEQIDSLKVGDIGYDEFALLNDIRQILPYTEFEGYNSYIVSYYDTKRYVLKDQVNFKKAEISIDTGKEDRAIFFTNIEPFKEEKGTLIKYFGGLNNFDNRIFEDNWLEDFNEKVNMYIEEDLFIIISTIASYPYKVFNGLWKGEKIDPFVLSYAFKNTLIEAKKNIDLYPAIDGEDKFSGWYHMWELYFTDSTLEDYLKSRNKSKRKEMS